MLEFEAGTAEPDRAEAGPALNPRRIAAVVILDICMIAELGVALYCASRSRQDFTLVFFRVFLSVFVPTLCLGWFAIRRLGSTAAHPVSDGSRQEN